MWKIPLNSPISIKKSGIMVKNQDISSNFHTFQKVKLQ